MLKGSLKPLHLHSGSLKNKKCHHSRVYARTGKGGNLV